jgi:hypothetical protein
MHDRIGAQSPGKSQTVGDQPETAIGVRSAYRIRDGDRCKRDAQHWFSNPCVHDCVF